MSSEIPATPAPAAEPPKEATPPEQAKPDDAKPQGFEERKNLPGAERPQEDWRYAFATTQRNMERVQQTNESLRQQNSALFGTVETLKGDIDTLLKKQMPEDEYKAHEAQRTQQTERAAAMAAAGNMQGFVVAQTGVFLDVLKASGIDPNDPAIDWARDSGNVSEWRERVGRSVVARVQRANEERIKTHEASLKAKSQEEIRAEAKALADQQARAAGIDRIDTAKGGRSTGTFVDRVRSIDRATPEGEAEWQKLKRDVDRGQVRI